MNDLAKTIAQACLDEIQRRPDTPSVDELAEVVRPMVPEMGWDLAEGPSENATMERVYDGTGWVYRRADPAMYQWAERLPWDKLRDPIADGPEHPPLPTKPPSSELIRQAYERVRDAHLEPSPPPVTRGGYSKSLCRHEDCGSTNAFVDPFSGGRWCLDCGRVQRTEPE